MLLALIFATINIIIDLTYAYLDPREVQLRFFALRERFDEKYQRKAKKPVIARK